MTDNNTKTGDDDTRGRIRIFYGEGVGKTSSAVGTAYKAASRNQVVHFIQFMKNGHSSEIKVFKKFSNIHYKCPGDHPFIFAKFGTQPIHFEHAAKALVFAWESLADEIDMLVCDEILNAHLFGVLKEIEILKLIDYCCKHGVELVMTGRKTPPEVLAKADFVTELIDVKHPHAKGQRPRRGIEF